LKDAVPPSESFGILGTLKHFLEDRWSDPNGFATLQCLDEQSDSRGPVAAEERDPDG
jgi:hypothetical protein